MRIVILGGSGNFGARIVRALKDEPGVELYVGARRRRAVEGAEAVRCVEMDLGSPGFATTLRELSPQLVIHCAGPYQGQDYTAARAALAAGAHYLDLADGREFVAGFEGALHAQALAVGRAAVTGASTLPGLSSAVVEALGEDLELRSIETVIAPGQRAPRGRATIEGVLSYVGAPIPVWQSGRWRRVGGWMDLRRVRLDIGTRLAAACDVPDLALFPERFAPVQTVTFHAALELSVQHVALWGLGALRRLGVPFSVSRGAVLLDRMAGLLAPWGGEQGGMAVRVAGRREDGRWVARQWQLVAPALNGPEIPCMPAVLLARRWARGGEVRPGAGACMGLLQLADFAPEFARWGIVTRTQETAP